MSIAIRLNNSAADAVPGNVANVSNPASGIPGSIAPIPSKARCRSKGNRESKWLSPHATAEIAGCSVDTIYRWVKLGYFTSRKNPAPNRKSPRPDSKMWESNGAIRILRASFVEYLGQTTTPAMQPAKGDRRG